MTRALRSLAWFAAGALPLLTGPSPTVAQDEGAFDRTPRDCITVATIDQTDALDDQNIIFHMRGNTVYRNHLPRRCPGLERENRIAYTIHSGRLCSIDTITVLEDSFGGPLGGFNQGFTCRLGEFVPLSPEEVEDLEVREDGRPVRSVIETESVDLEQTAQPAEGGEAEPAAPAEANND